jgi:site-specific recombinase XerD
MMLNAGCSLEALRLISGHSSIAQLSTYLCATTNQVEAAVNQIKF